MEMSRSSARDIGQAPSIPEQEEIIYWVSPGILSQQPGALSVNLISAFLGNWYRSEGVERRWSNHQGSWEYALSREEIGSYLFKSGRCNRSLIAKLEPAEIPDTDESPGPEFDPSEAWHWISPSTFSAWAGAQHRLRIYRNLNHAVDQGQIVSREVGGRKEFLVRESYIPELAFEDQAAFSAEELQKRTSREQVYPLRIDDFVVDAQARKWYGRTLWCDWKKGEIARLETGQGKVYFVTGAQRDTYGQRVYGSRQEILSNSESSLEAKLEDAKPSSPRPDDRIGVTIAQVMEKAQISYNGASNRLVKAQRAHDDITKTGMRLQGVTYWMSPARFEEICAPRRRGRQKKSSDEEDEPKNRREDSSEDKESAKSLPKIDDGQRSGYVPYTVEDKKSSWESVNAYLLQAGKVERLTPRDEFFIGETMAQERQILFDALFNSEAGLSLLVGELSEVARNRLRGYVGRDELAVDGGYEGGVPIKQIVLSALDQLRSSLELHYSDLRRLGSVEGANRRALEEKIDSGREQRYRIVQSLHLSPKVVGIIANRALEKSCVASELLGHSDELKSVDERHLLQEMAMLGERLAGAWENYKGARDRLINANRPLVVNVAKRYWGRGFQVIDLVMEGTIGLIRAAEYFDHRLGYKFSTIATTTIERDIERAIFERGNLVKTNREIELKAIEMRREEQKLAELLERPPTEEELCTHLGIESEMLRSLRPICREPISIDRDYGGNQRSSLLHQVAYSHQERPDQELASKEMRLEINKVLRDLPFRESGIILLRYGLSGWPLEVEEVARVLGADKQTVSDLDARITQSLGKVPNPEQIYGLFAEMTEEQRLMTQLRYGLGGEGLLLEQVGKVFGITRERVRQIEKRAKGLLMQRRAQLEEFVA